MFIETVILLNFMCAVGEERKSKTTAAVTVNSPCVNVTLGGLVSL